MNYFSSNLKFLTQNTEINQNQLSLRLNINRQNITKWLDGREPKFDFLIQICDIYNISVDDILKKDLSKK